MPTIANVTIPESDTSLVFPLPLEAVVMSQAPSVVTHRFDSGDGKISQRFLVGTNTRRFSVTFGPMPKQRFQLLADFFASIRGPYSTFLMADPDGSGQIRVRLGEELVTLQMVLDCVASGASLTLIEVPMTTPEYTISATVNRFPNAGLNTDLLQQTQEIIPLVRIIPQETGIAPICVSDRKARVGTPVYEPRLLDWSGIGQSVDGAADSASFTLGNADRVFAEITKTVNLDKATVEFSLFHVATGNKIDLWAGNIASWDFDATGQFRISATDGVCELRQNYPVRKASRTCWKVPAGEQGGQVTNCPFTGTCDRTFDGCGAKNSFGGTVINPETVYQHTGAGILSQLGSCGLFGPAGMIAASQWGGRGNFTAKSVIDDNLYGKPLADIFMDFLESKRISNGIVTWQQTALPVDAAVSSVRDENEFVTALGVLGDGEITEFGTGHTLNGALNHGVGTSRPNDGLRLGYGYDPLPDPIGDQFFDLSDTSNTYTSGRAAGTSFVELRTNDEEGRQLRKVTEFTMKTYVRLGNKGWMWDSPGTRYRGVLSNPIWIAINLLLKAKGVQNASAEVQESFFDVDQACSDAAFCNELVTKVVPGGNSTTRKRYQFRGVIAQEKPLKDWLREVLNTCLGGYTFNFGRMRTFLRANSGAKSAFTVGNIVSDSLTVGSRNPEFNQLTLQFGNGELDFINDSGTLTAFEHARMLGSATSPKYIKADLNLPGIATRDEAGMFAATRLKEELGGATVEEWKAARKLSFKTTILALETEPGMVCSLTHPEVPVNEPDNNTHEFRISSWKLNKDYSIDIAGQSVTDSVYDMLQGPNPADIEVSGLPAVSNSTFIPPNVSDVSVPGFDDSELVNTVLVKFKVPANPGTLTAVEVYDRMPHDASQVNDIGRFNIDFTAVDPDGYYTIKVPVSKPAADSDHILYLVSCSQVYTKALDLLNTPHTVQLAIFHAVLGGAVSAPTQPSTVTAGEKAVARTLDQDRVQWMKIAATCNVAPGNTADRACVWLSVDNGMSWTDQGVWSFNPANGLLELPYRVPAAAQIWRIKVALANENAWNSPNDAVLSNAFTVQPYRVPTNANSVTATIGTCTTKTWIDGSKYGEIPPLVWTDPPNGNLDFFLRWTVQDYDASGNALSVEKPHTGTQITHATHTNSEPLLVTYYAGLAKIRYRCYLAARPSQYDGDFADPTWNTLQKVSFNGGALATSYDVAITLPEAGFDLRNANPSTLGPNLFLGADGRPTTGTDSSGNILRDPGFEGMTPSPWTGWGQIVTTGQYTGKSCYRLPDTPWLNVSQQLALKPGSKWVASAWAKVDAGALPTWLYLFCNYFTDEGLTQFKQAIAVDGAGTYLPSDGSYCRITGVFQVPNDVRGVIFGLSNASTDSPGKYIYIDNVQLVPQVETGAGTTVGPNGAVQLNPGDGLATDSNGKAIVKTANGLGINAAGAVVPNFGATVGLDTNGQIVVPASSLGKAEFGNGLEPYAIYYGLPGGSAYATAPNMVINSATSPMTLWRKDGGGWRAVLDSRDIVASTVIALASISSPAISGGTITGATLTLNTNGVTTTVANQYSNGPNNYGLSVKMNTTGLQVVIVPNGAYLMNASNQVLALMCQAVSGASRGLVSVCNPANGRYITLDPDYGISVNGVTLSVP